MAKVKTIPATFPARLVDVIQEGLRSVGIDASISVEPIRGTRLHRVHVTSSAFDQLRPSERQDLLWRIVSQSFTPAEQLRISMILTLSPRERRGE
jgi:hypothetical protein